MFKRLRERLAEEANKLPVGQLGSSNGKAITDSENKLVKKSTEDLVTLSDSSSAVVVPQTSSQQFSIGEDDDGCSSEQNTPQKRNDVSNNSEKFFTPIGKDHSSEFNSEKYKPRKVSYVPQSDIESEREEPPTLNLENISKDQLMSAIEVLKARTYKYKNKYSEVVKNFKELTDEKSKIEKMLIDAQDKGSRRIAELREQCLLEQKAKAHLEENLRLMLEEKDSRICVLETQINLLKESGGSNSTSNVDLLTGTLDSESTLDVPQLNEKIERLEHQLNQAKKTITSQTEQILGLKKNNMSSELETKDKALQDAESKLLRTKADHEQTLSTMTARLEELEQQQEENAMSMAETKKNMHVELEFKEKQLTNAQEEAKQSQAILEAEKEKFFELQKKLELNITDLQQQLSSTEKTLEDEKQNLMQELNRGKSAAITLIQQESAKKISALDEEWKSKLLAEVEKANKSGISNLSDIESKLAQSKKEIEELSITLQKAKDENLMLKESLDSANTKNIKVTLEKTAKTSKEQLESTVNSNKVEYEKLKNKTLELEKEKCLLIQETEGLKEKVEKLSDVKSKLDIKEEEVVNLKQQNAKLKNTLKEKMQEFTENMKDKENIIIQLKSNIESLTKDNGSKIGDFKKRIKLLEDEREKLMIEAQDRVSGTEAKCKEDIKELESKLNVLLLENTKLEKLKSEVITLEKQLKEANVHTETSQKEISSLKDKLSKSEQKLAKSEAAKQNVETDLSGKLQLLQEENSLLVGKSNDVESLKCEKEDLNKKLKQAEELVSAVKQLEVERDILKQTHSAELDESRQSVKSLQESLSILEQSNSDSKIEIEQLRSDNDKLKASVSDLESSFEIERNSLQEENRKLSERLNVDCLSASAKDVENQIALIQQQCEIKMQENQDEFATKLKGLAKDFQVRLDKKEHDCDIMMAELIEKNQEIEEHLERKYEIELTNLRKRLQEKDGALDEIRDNYEEVLQEKEQKIREYETTIKSSQTSGSAVSSDSALAATEGSDWDDTWAVPDETIENTSPVHSSCSNHLQQIETLQDELAKSNSEIKELKILLRLSSPESIADSNSRRESTHSITEPTEFEYLRNIVYEYMMGKETSTLTKVIAAVLRFNDTQTRQVIRREESRHSVR